MLLLGVACLILLGRLLVELVEVGEKELVLVRHWAFALLVLRAVVALLARPLQKPVHARRSTVLEASKVHLSWLGRLLLLLGLVDTLRASILLLVAVAWIKLLLLRFVWLGLVCRLRLLPLVELLLETLAVKLLVLLLGGLLDGVRLIRISCEELLCLGRLHLAMLWEGTLRRLLLLLLDHRVLSEVLLDSAILPVILVVLLLLLLTEEALMQLLVLTLVATLEGLGLGLLGRSFSIALCLVLARLLELLLKAVVVLLGLPEVVLLLHLPHLVEVATVVHLELTIHATLLGSSRLGLLHLGRLLDGLSHLMVTA